VAADSNGTFDVFVRDLLANTTTRVSVDSNGGEADGPSFSASLSADDTRVVFLSNADNLVANDTNGGRDVFVHDTSTGSTVRANVDGSGGQGNLDATHASISGDGNVVAFSSIADNLVPPDDNFRVDCFLRDLSQGTTILVSRDPTTRPSDGDCYTPVSNADGSVIAFISGGDNLVANDTNGAIDIFVYDSNVTPLQAAWANYGFGLAGTLGVPSLALSGDPEFGATFSLQVGSSSGNWTVAFVAVGTARASLPFAGGTLLLLPSQILPFGLPPSGIPIDCTVPYDIALFGFVLDVQAIEIDAGASQGLSFTPGLELVFGQ
jgi:Tol biopolymer transport system component